MSKSDVSIDEEITVRVPLLMSDSKTSWISCADRDNGYADYVWRISNAWRGEPIAAPARPVDSGYAEYVHRIANAWRKG
ncbi:hypothetical protein [Mesorhizobium marinum]|uniref:hypothetical protein n=1 Tax=Mesorhizobium marinum TaxID=3228790 RepID=UPI0034661189